MFKYKKIFLGLFFLLLIAADQASKYIIRHSGGFYICNKNIAFGINIPPFLFWILWSSIIIFILLIASNLKFVIGNWGIKTSNYLPTGQAGKLLITNYSLILILSGAISNLIDRLYYGCITDFIDLKFWPVFNLADSFIVIGIFLLIIQNLKSKEKF
ncbi:MAG: signal peptidase II [Candidatus Moranbacteria bacterium]|nr:signal peptidase II [Candidatus Moranbacteria bacterium]